MVIDLQLLSLLLRFLSPFAIGLFGWYMWTLDQRLTPRKEFEEHKKDYTERQHKQELTQAKTAKDIALIKENITEMKTDLKEAIRKKNN